MADEVIETPLENSSHSNDATAVSSPAHKPAESAESAPAKGEREAFFERVAKAEGRETKPPGEPEKKEGEQGDSPSTAKTETPEGAPADKPITDEPGKEADPKADDPDKVLSQSDGAFHKQPEWQALKKVTGEKFAEVKPLLRKLFDNSSRELKQQVEKLKLSDTVVTRLRTATKGDQGLNDAVSLIERFDTDPASSVPMLEQLLADAKERAGLEISSNDLKPDLAKLTEQLDNGMIDQKEFDKQKGRLLEVEKARAKAKDADARIKATEQTEQQRVVEKLVTDRQTAIQQRIDLVWSKDPDFPKVEKIFFDRGTRMIEEATEKKGGLLSKEEIVQELDAAWKAVKTELGQLLPKPKTARPIINNGSSRNAVTQPSSELEAFKARVREREGG